VFIAPFHGPPFNEAWKNNVRFLADNLNATVLISAGDVNTRDGMPSNYKCVVSKNKFIRYFVYVFFIRRETKCANTIFIEMLPNQFKCFVSTFFLPHKKCIYRIISDSSFQNDNFFSKYFFRKLCHKFRCVIASDEEVQKHFTEKAGMSGKLMIVRPGVDLKKFRVTPCPDNSVFTLIMASTPLRSRDVDFRHKGIFILLKSLKNLGKRVNLKLILLWRNNAIDKISSLVKEMGIENVELVNGCVDVYEYFAHSDATILPTLSGVNTPHYPSSIMESIAVGRPVIVSNILPISKIIEKERCGIVVSPDVQQLSSAIETLVRNYYTYQSNCEKVARQYFDYSKNIHDLRQKLLF
jgi:glycosyltransferase involved in cell wall biosynthesis